MWYARIRSWVLGHPLAPEAEYRYVGEGNPCDGSLIDRRLSAPRHLQKTCVTPLPSMRRPTGWRWGRHPSEGSARAAQVHLRPAPPRLA